MEHSIDSNIAIKVGIKPAIVYERIKIFCNKNKNNKDFIKEGKVWIRISIKELKEDMTYLTERQIKNALDILVENEMIIKENFNEDKADRTLWYSIK